MIRSASFALLLALTLPSLAAAQGGPIRPDTFQGYWVGIDPLDGGDSRRSIVRLRDGRFMMAGRDTALSLCDDTDRGFISFGDGVFTGSGLQTERLTIRCTGIDTSVQLHAVYEVIADGVIVEHTTTPAGDRVSDIVLHRISAPQPGAVPPGQVANAFAGYWFGVDPVDGGDARRSLVRQADGRYAMAARDTVLTLCGGTDRAYVSFDDGEVIAGELVSNSATIQCTDGPSVVLHLRFEPIARGLLLEHASLPDGTPVSTIVLHRVGQ